MYHREVIYDMDKIVLIMVTVFVLAIALIIGVLNMIQNRKNKKYHQLIDNLEIQKNTIDSAPIMPELSKIESYLKNEKLGVMYSDWTERFQTIKNQQIPKLTDMLIEAEYSLSQLDYKSTLYKIAKLEMEIYKVRTNTNFLLSEIREITASEEKNRAIITKLKTKYRELYQRFTDTKVEFGEISNSITLQFENIAKRFETFENIMENNDYAEVNSIMKSIDEMLKHMEVVIEEVPSIVLTADTVLPKKIREIEEIYNHMVREGYPLDYLNVEYNIEEANKKMNDIMDRCRVLNLEDSLFELKVLLEYFDTLYNDFEKERAEKQAYDTINNSFKIKLGNMNSLVNDIFNQMGNIKNSYNLSKDDIVLLNEINEELKVLNDDYKILISHTSNQTFAYSKLTKEIETLNLKLTVIEDRLDSSLDVLGGMHEDEVRARQQLDEVKQILKDSKLKIRDYNLPVIPKSYITELNEAQAAIKEIIKELEKKPITTSVLNTRVDTARDLVLKLYSKTKEMMKTAMFAEMAIVYGNRYRSNTEELEKCLNASETLFYKGEYQKSLEISINGLNKIEPGIYDKLLNLSGK